jgi:tellurite resistance protein
MAPVAVLFVNDHEEPPMATQSESLHALAFLYLTFGHATDGSLTGDEMRALAKKLQAWNPDATFEELGEVLKATVAEYKATPSRQEKYARAGAFAEALVDHADAQTIVDDLAALAAVDGDVSDGEKSFIAEIAGKLGVASPL